MKAVRFAVSVNEEMELFTLDPTIARKSLAIRAAQFEAKWEGKWLHQWMEDATQLFGLTSDELCKAEGRSAKEIIIKACKERALKRKLRRKARDIGLEFWPALYARDVDPAAFVAAETILSRKHGLWNGKDCRGGWDAMGHHGLDGHTVRSMWFAAGCRDSEKFRMQIRKRIVAQKGESIEKFRQYCRGKEWLERNHIEKDFNRKAVAALGRLSPINRWAAVHQVGEGRIRIRDLNWSAVKEFGRMPKWKKCAQEYLPLKMRWQISEREIPVAIKDEWSRDPDYRSDSFLLKLGPNELPPKVWEELTPLPMEEFMPQAALHLFWGKELPRALKELYNEDREMFGERYLHEAGQTMTCIPETEYRDKEALAAWKRLAWKTKGTCFQFAGKFTQVREYLGRVPESYNELKTAAKLVQYTGVTPETQHIAELCAEYEQSNDRFQKYARLLTDPQPDWSAVPGVKVTGEDVGLEGEWELRRINTDDPIGPFLGLATNCCQHLGGAGWQCATMIWKNELSSAWVVRYKGNIVAQSYIWRDDSVLVIDSIEALSSAYVEGIARLYEEAIRQTLDGEKLGIKDVWLARTNYGITKEVRKLLYPDAKTFTNPASCPSDYTDARKVISVRLPEGLDG